MENFLTINENIESEITVKKSKFICNLIKIEKQEEAEEQIKKIKKKYHDARHNCVAYRVQENDTIVEKASDDGEPSGTAGGPMLTILQKNNLCNVLVVVTRYFGGILLGTGGLVRAYSDSMQNVLELTEKVEKCIGLEFEAELEYNNLETFNPTDTVSVGFNAFVVASVYNIFLLFKYSVSPTFTAFNFSKSSLVICFQSLLLSSTNPKFLSR